MIYEISGSEKENFSGSSYIYRNCGVVSCAVHGCFGK